MTALIGALAGALIYVCLAGALDGQFRPFSDDTHAWIIFALPTGLILGTVSGLSVSCHGKVARIVIGSVCIVTALAAGSVYSYFLHTTTSMYNFKYGLSESGPALMWSMLLLTRGVRLFKESANPEEN